MKDHCFVRVPPIFLEVQYAVMAARVQCHQDAGLMRAFFVFLDAHFRDVPANQRTHEIACSAASSCTRHRSGNRARNHQAQPRQRNAGAHSGRSRSNGGHRAANAVANANAGTFSGLTAEPISRPANAAGIALVVLVVALAKLPISTDIIRFNQSNFWPLAITP